MGICVVTCYDVEYTHIGRRLDCESGLCYYRHRTCHAQLGRFCSRDPIGYKTGANLLQYVGGSPVDLADPLGLQEPTTPQLEAGWEECVHSGKIVDEDEPEWYIPGITYEKHIEYKARVRYRCESGKAQSLSPEILEWHIVGDVPGGTIGPVSAAHTVDCTAMNEAEACKNGGVKLTVKVTVTWTWTVGIDIPLDPIGIPGPTLRHVVLGRDTFLCTVDCCSYCK
jgi:RHS repeat-associated protein